MTPDSLTRTVQDFLLEAHDAVVLEQGAVLFDLAQAKYSISGEHNKCLLHLWSAERNIVRRVVDLEIKHDVLRLTVQRLGQSSPTRLEICRERDRRTPTAKRAARFAYQHILRRILERRFSAYNIASLSTAMDLQHSFGPIYTRGLLKRGQSAFAVLGVNGQEVQTSIDAALTFGILWLDVCRQAQAGKCVIEGLKLFAPAGRSQLLRERMFHLNPEAAKWQLYEINQREDALTEIDISDGGNIDTHLVHAPDEAALQQRFAGPIARVHQLMSEVQIFMLSAAEIAFRCNGLEFARARLAHDPASFQSAPEITFGVGAEERVLTDQNMDQLVRLVRSIGEVRHSQGPRDERFWRLRPERWLESLVVQADRGTR